MFTSALLISGGFGFLSALTFLMSVVQGAVLVIYLPLVPLLLIGFHYGFEKALVAVFVGSLTLLLLNNMAATVMYVFFLAIPALITSYFMIKKLKDSWYPALRIITNLLVYAAITTTVIALYMSDTEGGLLAMTTQQLSDAYKDLDPALAQQVNTIVANHTYFLIATTGWLWAIMVYVMALVSHLILDSARKNIRPDFTLSGGTIASWLMVPLGVFALLSSITDGNVQFLARGFLLLFMLPYFLHGLTIIHAKTRGNTARGLILGGMYVLMVTTLWPALCIALYSIFLQLMGFKKPPVSTLQS